MNQEQQNQERDAILAMVEDARKYLWEESFDQAEKLLRSASNRVAQIRLDLAKQSHPLPVEEP